MTIKQRITVTQFMVTRVGLVLHEDTGELESIADVALLNELGQVVHRDQVSIPWSPAQKDALIAAIRTKKSAYTKATGWTEYVPDGSGPP